MEELLALPGRTAVITGGRRGIGYAIALRLAQAGADIVVVSKNSAAGEIEDRVRDLGRKFFYFQVDLCSRKERRGLLGKIDAAAGNLRILVNNAGFTADEMIFDCNWEIWDAAAAGMLEAPFDLTQQAIPIMRNRGDCSIVNITSINAVPHFYCKMFTYGVMKAALAKLTATSAKQLGADGIRVNAVAPGTICTDINRAAIAAHPEGLKNCSPLAKLRSQTPEDVANGVLYLVSPLGNYVNGHTLVIDGGTTA